MFSTSSFQYTCIANGLLTFTFIWLKTDLSQTLIRKSRFLDKLVSGCVR